MSKELADDMKNDEATEYAVFALELQRGSKTVVLEEPEQVTPWQKPDDEGGLEFDFSNNVRTFEIYMRLGDGTVIKGEHTDISITGEEVLET
jgi:hypothetical protein